MKVISIKIFSEKTIVVWESEGIIHEKKVNNDFEDKKLFNSLAEKAKKIIEK